MCTALITGGIIAPAAVSPRQAESRSHVMHHFLVTEAAGFNPGTRMKRVPGWDRKSTPRSDHWRRRYVVWTWAFAHIRRRYFRMLPQTHPPTSGDVVTCPLSRGGTDGTDGGFIELSTGSRVAELPLSVTNSSVCPGKGPWLLWGAEPL